MAEYVYDAWDHNRFLDMVLEMGASGIYEGEDAVFLDVCSAKEHWLEGGRLSVEERARIGRMYLRYLKQAKEGDNLEKRRSP